jgi:16S rRNA pseudouridine516 synthase
MQIMPEQSVVCIAGRRLEYKAVRHVMMNKPQGTLTAARDKKQKTVMDLLPPMYAAMDCMPAGRLDKDAEGLLLLTSNGELNHRLTSPKRHADKLYRVTLDMAATEADVEAFRQPMDLGDFITQPAGLELLEDGKTCMVTLREGKFHQIKRMFAHQGKTVQTLKRLAIGPLKLDETLSEGDWRSLEKAEIQALLTTADMM